MSLQQHNTVVGEPIATATELEGFTLRLPKDPIQHFFFETTTTPSATAPHHEQFSEHAIAMGDNTRRQHTPKPPRIPPPRHLLDELGISSSDVVRQSSGVETAFFLDPPREERLESSASGVGFQSKKNLSKQRTNLKPFLPLSALPSVHLTTTTLDRARRRSSKFEPSPPLTDPPLSLLLSVGMQHQKATKAKQKWEPSPPLTHPPLALLLGGIQHHKKTEGAAKSHQPLPPVSPPPLSLLMDARLHQQATDRIVMLNSKSTLEPSPPCSDPPLSQLLPNRKKKHAVLRKSRLEPSPPCSNPPLSQILLPNHKSKHERLELRKSRLEPSPPCSNPPLSQFLKVQHYKRKQRLEPSPPLCEPPLSQLLKVQHDRRKLQPVVARSTLEPSPPSSNPPLSQLLELPNHKKTRKQQPLVPSPPLSDPPLHLGHREKPSPFETVHKDDDGMALLLQETSRALWEPRQSDSPLVVEDLVIQRHRRVTPFHHFVTHTEGTHSAAAAVLLEEAPTTFNTMSFLLDAQKQHEHAFCHRNPSTIVSQSPSERRRSLQVSASASSFDEAKEPESQVEEATSNDESKLEDPTSENSSPQSNYGDPGNPSGVDRGTSGSFYGHDDENRPQEKEQTPILLSFRAQGGVPCQTVLGAALAGYLCAAVVTNNNEPSVAAAVVPGFFALTEGSVGDFSRVVGQWVWDSARLGVTVVKESLGMVKEKGVISAVARTSLESLNTVSQAAQQVYGLVTEYQAQQEAKGIAVRRERQARNLLKAQLEQTKADKEQKLELVMSINSERSPSTTNVVDLRDTSNQQWREAHEIRMAYRFRLESDSRARQATLATKARMEEKERHTIGIRQRMMAYRFQLESESRVRQEAFAERARIAEEESRNIDIRQLIMADRFGLEAKERTRNTLFLKQQGEKRSFEARRSLMSLRFWLEAKERIGKAKRAEEELGIAKFADEEFRIAREMVLFNLRRNMMAYRFHLEAIGRKEKKERCEKHTVFAHQHLMEHRFRLEAKLKDEKSRLMDRLKDMENRRVFAENHRSLMATRFQMEAKERTQTTREEPLEISSTTDTRLSLPLERTPITPSGTNVEPQEFATTSTAATRLSLPSIAPANDRTKKLQRTEGRSPENLQEPITSRINTIPKPRQIPMRGDRDDRSLHHKELMKRILAPKKQKVKISPSSTAEEKSSSERTARQLEIKQDEPNLRTALQEYLSPEPQSRKERSSLSDPVEKTELNVLRESIQERYLERARSPYARKARRLRTYLKEKPLPPSTSFVQIVALHVISASAPMFTMINYRNGRKPYL